MAVGVQAVMDLVFKASTVTVQWSPPPPVPPIATLASPPWERDCLSLAPSPASSDPGAVNPSPGAAASLALGEARRWSLPAQFVL